MKKLIYLIFGAAVALVVLGLHWGTSLFEAYESMMYNNMFKLGRAGSGEGEYIETNPDLNQNIYIIGVDEAALETFGQWPFPNTVHARFLEHLAAGAPEMVFMDLLFVEPTVDVVFSEEEGEALIRQEPRPGVDQALAAALETARQAGVKVYLPYPADIKSSMEQLDTQAGRLDLMEQRGFFFDNPVENPVRFNYIKPPLPELLATTGDVGFVAAVPEKDATYRTLLLAGEYEGRLNTHLILDMARDYYQVSPRQLDFTGHKGVLSISGARVPEYDAWGAVTGSHQADLQFPVDKRNRMLINFAGPPGEFLDQGLYLSYSDVFALEPDFFQGKYLFVGAYTQGIHDIWVSPYGPMYGIEFNANSFNMLIQNNVLHQVPAWLEGLIVAALCMLMAFLTGRLKTWQAFLVFFALIIAYLAGAYLLFTRELIISYWVPLFAVLIGFLASITYRILVEEREKRFIKARFNNYVSPQVVDELLKNPRMLELGGEDRELTVFFSDIRSFTSMSESLDPQALVTLLNEYLSSMTGIIIENQGTLDKYVGDEIMAFWGAPLQQEDHALRACRAACLQLKYLYWVLHPLAVLHKQQPIEIGCGINTGLMTVGNMGSRARMDYTVMGDNVNLGARLEGVNKIYTTRAIISVYTYERVRERVVARELDQIAVKGKQQPVLIYELLGIEGEAESFYTKPPELLSWEREARRALQAGEAVPKLPQAVCAYWEAKGLGPA